jgi:hypothetical protein
MTGKLGTVSRIPPLRALLDGSGLLHYADDSMHPGSGVRFFEIGRGRAGFRNETPAGQFRKTEHLTPVPLHQQLSEPRLEFPALLRNGKVVLRHLHDSPVLTFPDSACWLLRKRPAFRPESVRE